MGEKIDKIDDYIDNAEAFARPVLKYLRQLVHDACPAVEEGWKWNFPHFLYSGEILCSMAAFKNHCVFTLWKAALLKDPNNILNKGEAAMGQFGKIRSHEDLPSDEILISYIKEAALLNKKGIKLSKAKPNQEPLLVPDYFENELKKDKLAYKNFYEFSYSNKKEYIDWITGAKTDATRNKRLGTAIDWLSEGKVKNWKYIKK